MNTIAPRPVDAAIAEAAARFGERLSVNPAIRAAHARGEDTTAPTAPDAVLFARDEADVSALLRLCHAHGVPVTPFGAGTSLEGHVNPVRGGISLDLSRMNAILEVSAPDMDCLVQPGVTRQQLNDHLRETGLFFPVDPGSHCTIGGMCATRASGTNAVRYGTIRENVLALEAVLADGTPVRAGARARKAANGYDLAHLLIGSEGTLGVITKVRLRLHGIPEAVSSAVVQFPALAGAVEAVIETLQAGIPVARIELLDEVQVEASVRFSKLGGLAPRPALFLEFHGTEASVAEQAEAARAIAAGHGGLDFRQARAAEARNALWKARHDAYWACLALKPNHRGVTTDVCVPISRLAEALLGAKADIVASGLTAPIVGHVGDGNFHAVILVDQADPGALDRAWALDRAIVARALALGGTCSGEHGIGLGKREFLRAEHGEAALDAMRAIKRALDPRGILNPGKILPE